MRQGTCCQCGLTTSIRSFYSLNGMTYCEPCVWKASREAKESGLPSEYVSLTDNSICARCGAHNDTAEFPLLGKHPLCPACGPLVSNWPYPRWLKLSLVGLLALLGIALLHGRRYFHAGRTMYIGERLVGEQRYAEALPYLRETLDVAPGSDKAVLLAAKAALLSGDVETAQKVLKAHNNGYFEDGNDSDVQEVDGLFKRVVAAFEKADQAAKLEAQRDHGEEAARLMSQAASMYPESSALAQVADNYEAGAAFDRQDYDRFLTLAQKQWNEHPNSETAAGMSSALACKYATTGEASYRQQSEELLGKAQQLAAGDPAQDKPFQEYAERIRYRLASRQIIDKPEYDRRFRSGQTNTSQ
jgi:Tetratricopeptide repeat